MPQKCVGSWGSTPDPAGGAYSTTKPFSWTDFRGCFAVIKPERERRGENGLGEGKGRTESGERGRKGESHTFNFCQLESSVLIPLIHTVFPVIREDSPVIPANTLLKWLVRLVEMTPFRPGMKN